MPDHNASATDLTLEQKAALTSGFDFWTTKSVPGVPSVMLTDGPHGLRKQQADSDHLGINDSIPATCFPPAAALGSSFDVDLARRVGEAIGREAAIEDVAVALGPGVNIKRSPLGGRNFEYFSEDPIVSARMGTGLVHGIQSQGVGSSLKHFAANNQEHDRMRASSDIDPRPLHEIYLRAFQGVVEDAAPWTVMCSYNKINGVYASEDPWLLTSVLRDEWGFEGLVVSDWGAVNERVPSLAAGMDLEMPSSGGRTDAEIVAAVKDGSLEEAVLDRAVDRILSMVHRAGERPAVAGPLDADAHHALAREAAGRSMVLLKNDDAVLPLRPDQRIAVIGDLAKNPRFQGAGSSLINPTRVDNALDAIREVAPDAAYASGADVSEAVSVAAAAGVAVVFLGVPAEEESEGFDRRHIDLPAAQIELVGAVAAANPRTVVVLSNGGVVALPFASSVAAILEGWLLGQAGGSATADVLFGEVNPGGRLTETIPHRLEDTPAFLGFPGEHGHVRYGEGLFVGYRWYDARAIDVAFPFGHGLSYTTFGYGEVSAEVTGDGDVVVRVPVTNTGEVTGREVVQAYVSLPGSAVVRPPRELKGFTVVQIEPGQTVIAEVLLRRRDLTYWDTRVSGWLLEPGTYVIEVGSSSRDFRTRTEVPLDGDDTTVPLTLDSSLGELLAHPVAGPLAMRALAGEEAGAAAALMADEGLLKMMESTPLRRLIGFGIDEAALTALFESAD